MTVFAADGVFESCKTDRVLQNAALVLPTIGETGSLRATLQGVPPWGRLRMRKRGQTKALRPGFRGRSEGSPTHQVLRARIQTLNPA